MSAGSDIIDNVRAALRPHGLFVRGLVCKDQHPHLMPDVPGRNPVRTVVLIGPQGGSNWPHFRNWQATEPDRGGAHPLDQWSKSVVTPLAFEAVASVWFPSDPPWQPFQQWAMAADGLKPSPLGILMHPVFGLWHSYRAALGFDFVADPEPVSHQNHPCDTCEAKPCLLACPVSAVALSGFDVSSCRSHLKTEAAQGECMQRGCLARNACPVGAEYRYSQDQLQFHMAALS